MESVHAKQVQQEVTRSEDPKNAKPIRTMWVQATKTGRYGYVMKLKDMLVALGTWQRPVIDFTETLSLVARMASFKFSYMTRGSAGSHVVWCIYIYDVQ